MEAKSLRIYILAILVFLFPVAGFTVRHWYSGITALVVLVGLYVIAGESIKDRRYFLRRFNNNEIMFMLTMVAFFVSTIVSGIANGWRGFDSSILEREIHFLFFVPLYVAISYVRNASYAISVGSVLAGVVFLIPYINEIVIHNAIRVGGTYGHLFIGPVATIMFFIQISMLYYAPSVKWKVFIIISAVVSLLIVAYSRSGTAYFLFCLMMVASPFVIAKNAKVRLAALVVFILAAILAFNFNSRVIERVEMIKESLQKLSQANDIVTHKLDYGSTGNRIMFWLTSWEIFKDNPILGVGRGNYQNTAKQYYAEGRVHFWTTEHTHPHSIYTELLVSKGLLGFSIFAFIVFQILRCYYYAWRDNLVFSRTAVIHILGILFVGLASEGPLIKNNFTVIFLVFVAVYFRAFSLSRNVTNV